MSNRLDLVRTTYTRNTSMGFSALSEEHRITIKLQKWEVGPDEEVCFDVLPYIKLALLDTYLELNEIERRDGP